MKQYRTVNNLVGWITFLIAATVYCMTIEPTASFWDCPEFITTGYKLEVGHPPGAPFFMLVANLFSQFASDPSTVAKMVNYMSALMSGACTLFLFWSITHLVRKLVVTDENNITRGQLITIMGSGLVGALAYTFSDTFWFSAVEGEVYAFSSLFTAVVFWLILKWEDVANEPHSDRWLILIAYLTGLSIGVHLLNLLCLPAIVLVYYYKKVPNANAKGSLLALLASGILVAAVLYGMVPGIVKVGGWFELFFVNTLGMSFNSGVMVYIIVLAASIIWGVYESYTETSRPRMNISFMLTIALLGIPFYGHGASSVIIGIIVLAALGLYLFAKKLDQKYQISARTMNTALLCTMMIMVGYSSYALIVIRSTANTPMDQNSPEDIFTLGEYLGREQYGTRPLFYGQAYSSKVELEVKDGYCVPVEANSTTKYIRKEKTSADEKDSYIEVPGRVEYKYAQNMLFPRMYSSAHAAQYKGWVDIDGVDVPYDECGNAIMVNIPTQWENIKFFFRYQLNFMYWRYFMWNFAGRQNDLQGSGEIEHGNWITGIPFIDNWLVGDQSLLPQELKDNKGHNVFYCLPLLLGIIGLLWQAYRGQKGVQQFWVVFFLFFMTGIAIVLYLNQTPSQPRERDYAYAGSFYAFAIWVGMGVAGIIKLLQDYAKMKELPTSVLVSVLCLLVPIQMASQTWDDHDRSGRYVCRDFGANYLESCEPNAILFTNGDNDTFPLWYAQEVEGIRTDVRVCNTSYLQTDWYADQMKKQAYESEPLPISWTHDEYVQGTRDFAYIFPMTDKPIHLNTALEFVRSDDPKYKKIPGFSQPLDYIPSGTLIYPIDSVALAQGGLLKNMDVPVPAKEMTINLKGKDALGKQELLVLNMLQTNDWKRPMYYAITVSPDQFVKLDPYFQQTGMAYQIVPMQTQNTVKAINSEKMFDNVMNKFKWGGVDKPGIYLDENVMRMCKSYRMVLFGKLAATLIHEGKNDKALQALDKCMEVLPPENVPLDYSGLTIGESYYLLGEKEKGHNVLKAIGDNSLRNLNWYFRLTPKQFASAASDVNSDLYTLQEVIKITKDKDPELTKRYQEEFDNFRMALSSLQPKE